MTPTPTARPALARATILLLALAGTLLAAPAALAQGTSGLVPDPISSRELSRYTEMLDLSPQQRLAIDMLHDEYRSAFRTLREGEIEAYLQKSGSLQPSMRMIFDRDAVKESMKDLEDVMAKIKVLDDRLLDQLGTVLTEDQLARMPRVREARSRTRHSSGLARFARFANPAAQIDVSELVRELDLEPHVLERVDPMLRQYEGRLTSEIRRIYEGTNELARELFDRLDKEGFTQEVLADRRQRGRMFEAFQRIFSELVGTLTERTTELSELNRRTVRQLLGLLPADDARALRDRYYTQAYAEAGAMDNPARRRLESAAGMDTLDPDSLELVRGLLAGFLDDTDRITDQAADLIDEQRESRQPFLGMRGGGPEREKYEEDLAEFKARRARLNDQALAALRSALTPEQQQALDTRVARAAAGSGGGDAGTERVELMDPAGRVRTVEMQRPEAADEGDAFLPGPIDGRDVGRYAERLGLDDTGREVLGTMHGDYLEAFRTIDRTQVKAVREAQQGLWQIRDGDGRITPPSAEAVERLYSLRRQALQSIRAIDGLFFEDMQGILERSMTELLQRLRLSRDRDIYSAGLSSRGAGSGFGRRGRGWSGFGSGAGADESSVDVSRILDQVDLAGEVLAALDPILLEYEQAATDVFRAAFETNLDLQEAMQKAGASGERGGWGARFRQIMEGEGRLLREARETLIQLNRGLLLRLEGVLSEAALGEVQRSYYARAFPDLFEDPQSAAARIAAALSLEDLTPHQRTGLGEISAEFHGRYDELCLLMVEARLNDRTVTADEQTWRNRMERERTIDRVRADRDDLNHKVLLRMRALLNDQQRERVGL